MSCKNFCLLWYMNTVFETLHPGVIGLCWSGMYIIKVWLKRLITFACSQPGDRGFCGGVCIHYNIDH